MSLPSFIPWVSYLLTLAHKKATKGYMQELRKCTKSDYIIGGGLIWARNRCPGRDTRVGCLKWYVPLHSHPPGAQSEVVLFLVSNESPYFSHYSPKLSASNSLYFGSYSRKCTYYRYTNFDFLGYFHNSLIPVSHTFATGENNEKLP